MLNHDKGLFTITSGSMTGFNFFLKKEEVSSSLLHCVACGCSRRERKKFSWEMHYSEDERFSRNGGTIKK